MLGLKLPTDPRWAQLATANLREAMIDHAFCEQKAASNAISIIVAYPEYDNIVTRMAEIAQEELQHFQQVHQRILARGWSLGPERKDPYVNRLQQFMRKGVSRRDALVERLLFAAMIEARSCERFKVLTQAIDDPDLAAFYRNLMISEAGHYTTFLQFARQVGDPAAVDARWQEFLEYEAQVIAEFGTSEAIHG